MLKDFGVLASVRNLKSILVPIANGVGERQNGVKMLDVVLKLP
ncbi:hypothetical protein [Peribacillus muralis]|nr:hypothetical protein [Peribacillus muralis]